MIDQSQSMGEGRGGRPGSGGRRPRVLIVEEEDALRAFLAELLPHHGFAVLLAASGREALKACHRGLGRIDVVLMDVGMVGMDGLQTLRTLRALGLDAPCCFMTGGASAHTEEELQATGAARMILKPFRLEDLAAALWQLAAPPEGQAGRAPLRKGPRGPSP